MPRPVAHAAAGHVARTDHEVVASAGRQHGRQILRIVREVGIHGENEVIARRDRLSEAGSVSCAEPKLAGPVDHLDRGRRAASSSAIAPVPSGELSSTTIM